MLKLRLANIDNIFNNQFLIKKNVRFLLIFTKVLEVNSNYKYSVLSIKQMVGICADCI